MGSMSRMAHGFVGRLCHQPSFVTGWAAEGPEFPELTHCADHLAFPSSAWQVLRVQLSHCLIFLGPR